MLYALHHIILLHLLLCLFLLNFLHALLLLLVLLFFFFFSVIVFVPNLFLVSLVFLDFNCWVPYCFFFSVCMLPLALLFALLFFCNSHGIPLMMCNYSLSCGTAFLDFCVRKCMQKGFQVHMWVLAQTRPYYWCLASCLLNFTYLVGWWRWIETYFMLGEYETVSITNCYTPKSFCLECGSMHQIESRFLTYTRAFKDIMVCTLQQWMNKETMENCWHTVWPEELKVELSISFHFVLEEVL